MYLLVGLGNPGSSYELNRHNVGFMTIDEICNKFEIQKQANKFDAEFYKGIIDGQKIFAIKPQTFMNLSGKSVSQFVNFYKIQPENVIVFYDDLDLAFGKVKISKAGSSAGHNGIKSIDSFIKNEYIKFKIGIDRPDDKDKVSNYVLSDFSKEEISEIGKLNSLIAQNLAILLKQGREEYLNKLAIDRK